MGGAWNTMVGRDKRPTGRLRVTDDAYNRYYHPHQYTVKCEGSRHFLPTVPSLATRHFITDLKREVCLVKPKEGTNF